MPLLFFLAFTQPLLPARFLLAFTLTLPFFLAFGQARGFASLRLPAPWKLAEDGETSAGGVSGPWQASPSQPGGGTARDVYAAWQAMAFRAHVRALPLADLRALALGSDALV